MNKAIQKIREALDDDDANPRFVAAVEPVNGDKRPRANGGAESHAVALALPPSLQQPVADKIRGRPEKSVTKPTRDSFVTWLPVVATAVFVLGAVLAVDFIRTQAAAPSVTGYKRLTEGANITWVPIGTDGTRIYFSATDDEGRPMIASVSTSGGPIVRVPMPVKSPFLEDVSPDGTKLLVSDLSKGGEEPSSPEKVYYVVPAQGGSARHIDIIDSNCAGWGADSRQIIYCSYEGTFIVGLDGPFPGTRLSPGGSWPRPSPNGRTLVLS